MTIDPTGVARAEAGVQLEEKRSNAEANGGGPAGALVFHIGALRWIPPEPLRRLAHAVLEGYSTRFKCVPQAVEWKG